MFTTFEICISNSTGSEGNTSNAIKIVQGEVECYLFTSAINLRVLLITNTFATHAITCYNCSLPCRQPFLNFFSNNNSVTMGNRRTHAHYYFTLLTVLFHSSQVMYFTFARAISIVHTNSPIQFSMGRLHSILLV